MRDSEPENLSQAAESTGANLIMTEE